MVKSKKFQYFEIALYLFISIAVLIIPLFTRFENGREWNFIIREWIRLIPFFIIFLINNFILAPKLLLKSKFIGYIILSIILLFSISFVNNLISRNLPGESKFKHETNRPKKEFNDKHHIIKQIHPEEKHKPTPPNRPLPPHKLFLNFGILIVGFLIIGFNSGIKIFIRWTIDQEEHTVKENQYLNSELAFLKYQISPHFFMNTLNNIHALIDINQERAQNVIIKLSHLMRYLLYETNTEKIPLKKEIEFIESYIELMRLRYDENKLSINISYFNDSQTVFVPSLLVLPLIENAFKHGIKNNVESFVDIQLNITNNYLTFKITNSNFAKISTDFNKASGIGLENIRKRLKLIYKESYSMHINANNEIYEVTLTIPIE